MAHGLEVRVPFVDHELLDTVWPELGRHPTLLRRKRLLVETLERPLPQAIVGRPKQGFTLPFADWMRGELAPVVRDGLGHLARAGWIAKDAPARVWHDVAVGRRALEPAVGARRARTLPRKARPMSRLPSVAYLAPDKMGGVITVIAGLLDHRGPGSLRTEVLLVHNHLSTDTRFAGRLNCDLQTTIEHTLPIENLRAVLRRMARAVSPGPGIIVPSDLIDLAMLSVHDVGRAVVLILHGDSDYYYDLAQKHDAVVHAYVVASQRMYARLMELLPHRASSIFHLPYGIPLPPRVRTPTPGPLRLIFAGRVEHNHKGVMDLPAIDVGLRARGIARTWTIVGGGPDEARLATAWAGVPGVRFAGTLSQEATVEQFADHDVFVLPTRSEGFPLALLEAMGAGAVPVISDIPSGVPDLVESHVTGLRPPAGDVDGFVTAIAHLATDRAALEQMSASCRHLIETQYDIRNRATAYEALFARYAELYRPLSPHATLHYGSRLDQPWIPNQVVRLVRTAIRMAR